MFRNRLSGLSFLGISTSVVHGAIDDPSTSLEDPDLWFELIEHPRRNQP